MWYREGTNSFEKGSKTVAGVGTFWSQAKYGVMPGMVLIGADNLLYEIESVQSNTELTLVEAYKGNSIKDQPCRIITTYEGDLSQFSARFSALLHSISGDSREIRNWLTSPSPVVIVRDDGTTFKADSLETIYAAHKARIEWFDKNKTLISDAGNQAANAAGSAKAAKDSQIAAKASETQAANLTKSAHDSQVAASASQSATKTSETNAKTSEINAANSAKAAVSSQTAAKASETNAVNAANGASASQTAAKISETNAGNFSNAAKASELASKTSETNAKSSEVNAKSSETNAKSSSNSATEKAKQAASSQIAAKASETSAAASKDASAKSASNASASASKAEQEANKAISSANNAATSASGSASSANSAKTSETNAKSSENKASTSETNAKASENNASASKLAAEKSAKDAASTLAKMGNDAKIADNAAKAAKLSENNSRASELAAKTSETNTANAAKAAKVSQDAAKSSETNAANSTIVASAAQTAAKASETVAISSKNAAQEAANLATKKAESAAASESKAQDAANRATLSAKEKENLLKGKTVTISLGTHVATWTKIATVIMPQAASTVRIEIVGGSGFNTGEYQQAAMAEIVLRSGNDHPKGISASIYRTNIAAANHVATINTKDDEYDVYVHFGAYPFNLIFNVQQSNNATILNLGQLSKSSETLPEGVREGKTYHYILASAVDNQGNISIDKNIYGPGFVSGAQGQDRTWLEPKEGNACWLANIGDKYVGEFRHPKKSGTAAIVEDHYTKGESDGKYQPKGGYANAASHTFSGEIRAPYVISGSENNQSYFMHRNGIWAWTAQQAGVWKGEVQHPGRAGVLALQGDSYSKGESDGKYQTKIGQYISFGESQQAWTTAQFIDWIKSKGAFDTGYWLARGSWWYAGNCYITDTGVGNIHLAGCTVEVVGLINGYTIKIITPTTSASGEVNKEFIYVNNSNGVDGAYSPGWRRLYNTSSPPTAAEVGAYSKDETNQNFVKSDTTNLGKTWTSLTTMQDGGWAQPIGYSTMVHINSVGLPNGFSDHGYWHVVAARDMAQGYAGFLTSFNNRKVYYGFSNTKEGNPTWVKVYTESHKPSLSELDVYSKGESDGKYALKNSQEELKVGYLSAKWVNDYTGLKLIKPDNRYAVIETTPHGGAPINFIYREPNGTNISVASLPTETGVIALQGYSYSKAEADGKYHPKIGQVVSFGESQKAWTTAQFVDWIKSKGAFDTGYWLVRGSWWYAGNCYITDTGVGNIHLAGCTVEVVGLADAYTIKIITPTTSASGEVNKEFIYVNNANGTFSPGWRRLYNTSSPPTASEVGAYSKNESDSRYFEKSINLSLTGAYRRHIIFNNGSQIDGYIFKDPDGHLMFNNGVHGGNWQMQTDGSFYCGGKGNFSGELSAPKIITGAENNQSFFYQHEGAWRWTVQQGGTWKGEIQHPGRGGVFALQGDSYTKDESDGKYQSRGDYAINQNVVPNSRQINGKLLSSDITLNATDVGAFRTGLTDAISEDNVPWNAASGVYNALYGGHTQIIVHFSMGAGNTSTPSLQFKSVYKNNGIAYRSARDGYGFEEPWTEFYTTKNKPSASDVDAYSKSESDSRHYSSQNYIIKQSGGHNNDLNNWPNNSVAFVYHDAENSAQETGVGASFSALNSNYVLQLVSRYYGNGDVLKFRTKNGDNNTWNPWHFIATTNWTYSQGDIDAKVNGRMANGTAYTKGESDEKYQPKGSYANADSHGFSGDIRAPNIFTGSVNNQSFFFQRDGVWVWTVQQGGAWKGEIQHPGRGGVFALQGDCYTKDESDGKYHPKIGQYISFGESQQAWTTAQFVDWIKSKGAFDTGYWLVRGSWWYAGNCYITDTGVGNIHLAGCTVEVVGLADAYTIKIITPTTSASGEVNKEFIYVNNANGTYSPGWRRLYNTSSPPTASEVGAYSKGESDSKYQIKGNFANQGDCYTKGESDGRYFEKSGNLSLIGAYRRHIIFNNGSQVDGYIYKDPNGHMMFNNGVHGGDWQMQTDGSFYCAGNGNFNDVYIRSDKRAKNDIQKISDAGKKLSKLSGYTYTVSDDNKNSSRSAGLIAQEVQKVLPEAVTQDENDLLRLNYNSVIGLLVEAVKDLQKQVDELTKNR